MRSGLSNYLQKYIGKTKKPKDFKKTKSTKNQHQGLKIVDEDESVGWKTIRDKDDEENKPVIVDEETRNRHEAVQRRNEILSKPRDDAASGWRDIVLEIKPQKDEDNSPIRRRPRHDSDSEDDDLSPPRQQQKQDLSPVRKRDLSPARESDTKKDLSPVRHPQKDEDYSPVRRRPRHDSEDDLSPPRQHERDLSPPRRTDLSSVKRNDEDLSPPRRKDDLSPVRQKRESPVQRRDSSPIRKRDDDLSPVRHRRDSSPVRRESSPVRRESPKRRSRSPDRKRDRSPSDDRDLSPKRRRRDSSERTDTPNRIDEDGDISPIRRRRRYEHRYYRRRRSIAEPVIVKRGSEVETEDVQKTVVSEEIKPVERMSTGEKSGLKTAEGIQEEIEKMKQLQQQSFQQMDPSLSGQFATAVYRDKQGKAISFEEHQRLLKEEEEEKKKKQIKVIKQTDLEWGSGLIQKQQEESYYQRMEKIAYEPFAQHDIDKELDEKLKQQIREGDPMAQMLLEEEARKRKKKHKKKKKTKERPIYQGPFPPNRFGIRPGFRWDGKDRSNGFERKFFEEKNRAEAERLMAYRLSSADM
jgi:pre-mRNA-splicing factor CWC26